MSLEKAPIWVPFLVLAIVLWQNVRWGFRIYLVLYYPKDHLMKKSALCFFTGVLSLAWGVAHAQTAPVSPAQMQPLVPNAEALEYLRSKGNVLQFIGTGNGLDAYMAEAPNGSIQTFYIAPDGKGILAGLMFDTLGRNVTMAQVMNLLQTSPDALQSVKRLQENKQKNKKSDEELTPQEMLAKAQVVFSGVEKTNWFRMGREDAPVVYIVIDPNCPWCERAIRYLEPEIAAGTIQLRVIAVGTLTETSMPKAAAIVSAQNPVEALNQYEGRAKAPPAIESVTQDDILLVRQNEQFIRDFELEGTPFFIFRDYQGIPRLIRGLPKNMPDDVMKMIRVPSPQNPPVSAP